MVAIDLIVQHVHSQLEEVSDPDTEGMAPPCGRTPAATLQLPPFDLI